MKKIRSFIEEPLDQIRQYGIVPVIVLDTPDFAAPLAEALLQAKLPIAEITFRTEAAEACIREIAKNYPEILLGAGTIVTKDQAKAAVNAGARFLVSPALSRPVVEWCLRSGVFITPGVATPRDVQIALDLGLSTLKFFPAEALGGVRTLKAISRPYQSIEFIPTGGINAQNLASYLELRNVCACGGSWIASRSLINTAKFEEITRLADEARKIIAAQRGNGVDNQ